MALIVISILIRVRAQYTSEAVCVHHDLDYDFSTELFVKVWGRNLEAVRIFNLSPSLGRQSLQREMHITPSIAVTPFPPKLHEGKIVMKSEFMRNKADSTSSSYQ